MNTLNILSAYNAKVFTMESKRRETLAEYVRRVRREKGLSLTDVKRQSRGKISDAYVSLIEHGHAKNVTTRMLHALAHGLQVPDEELFAVARGKPLLDSNAREQRLLNSFRQLPPDRQEDLIETARMLQRRHGLNNAGDANAQLTSELKELERLTTAAAASKREAGVAAAKRKQRAA